MEHISLGQLYVIAAASGTGKTSLVTALVETLADLRASISYTTRAPRPGEIDGINYFFVEESLFLKMKARGEFLENAQVFNHYYGTHAAHVDDLRRQGIDVILEIDWQGAQLIRERCPDAIGIFIVPPSLSVLKNRLESRGTDSPDIIVSRLAEAQTEISHYCEFDYLIVNDAFDRALADLMAIIRAERLRIKSAAAQQSALMRRLLA